MLLMATNRVHLFTGKYLLFLTDAEGDRSSLEYLPRPVFRPSVRARRSTTSILPSIINNQEKEKQSPQRIADTLQQNQDMPKRSLQYYTSPPSVTFCTSFANQGIATPLPAVSSPATAKGKR
jgi:hypothetical protein